MRPAFSAILFIPCFVLLLFGCNKSAPPGKAAASSTAVPAPAEYDLAKLAADLKSSTPGRRDKAIQAAGDFDADGEDVIPTLLEALKDPTSGESGRSSLSRVGSTREAAVKALLDLKVKGKKALVDSGLSTHPDKGCPRKVGGRTTCQHQWFDLSPDGRNVAFVQQPNHHPGSYGVSTMDLTTGRVAVLEATLSRDSRPIEGVRWSPDGSKLVYSRTDDLGVLGRGGSPRTDLLIIDADGLNRHRLDLQGISAGAPDWSPDGQTIAFASDIWRTDAEHESDIYTIGADGTSMRRLSTDGDRYQPAWLSDGRILYWSGDRFWIMTANGEDASPLPLLAGLDRPISGTGLPWSGLRVQPKP